MSSFVRHGVAHTRWSQVKVLIYARGYPMGEHFSTLHFHLHPEDSLQDLSYLSWTCPLLVFELSLRTASLDRAVSLMYPHEVAGFGRSSSGWLRDLHLATRRDLNLSLCPFSRTCGIFFKHPTALFD